MPVHAPPDGSTHQVAEAIGRLPEADREVLLLTCWEGLSPDEVAVALGLAAGTARTRLHRARQRLSRELGLPATSGSANDTTTEELA